MKILLTAFFIIIVVILTYFISVGFYLPIIIPLACFFIIMMLAFFKSEKNEQHLKNLILISSFAYITLCLVWPKYIALRPPGFPPLHIARLVNLLALSAIIFAIFSSKWYKKEIASSIRETKATWFFFGLLVFFRFASIFISKSPGSGIYLFMSDMFVHWLFIFAGIYIGSNHRNFMIFAKILTTCFFINFFLVLGELALGRNLFLQFVNVSDPTLEWILTEKLRGGSYRAQSVFIHPIVFAEFSSISFCFATFMLSRIKNNFLRYIAMFFSALSASVMVIASGSRSGYIAIAITISLVTFAPLVNALFRGKMNLKTATLWSFLIGVLILAVSILSIMVYDYTFGKYAVGNESSNYARLSMVERAASALFDSPISPILGHGVGTSAELVGVETYGAKARYTIDSLFITYGIDSGLIVLISFIALIVISAFRAFRTSLYGDEENWFIWYTIGSSIITFALFKSILSLNENNFLLYIIFGITASSIVRNKKVHTVAKRA